MATTRADFYTTFRRLVSCLNAGTASSFSTVLDDPRRSAGELFASLQAADDEVCALLAETTGQGFRPLFLSDSGDLSHGDALPDRLGPLAQVKIKHVSTDADYKTGKTDKNLTLADIERWRANVGSIYGANHDAANSSLSGFYLEVGDEIFFTGYRAKGKVATYARTSRDVTDGAMVSASKNLTSATAVFTSADAGGAALVDGAGASGVPLVSRIDTFTNSTTVILRDANASGGNIVGKTVTIAKLQSPQSLEDFVLAIALINQVKKGDNSPFLAQWMQAASIYRQLVKAGQEVLPALEVAQAA